MAVIKPTSRAQRAIEFIRSRGEASSPEIAEHLGIESPAVSSQLNYYVRTGVIDVSKAPTGHQGPALNIYRIKAAAGASLRSEPPIERRALQAQPADGAARHHDPRAPAGRVPGRPMRLGPSLSDREIALGRGSGTAVPPVDNRATAAAAQPAVADNTGSTDAVEPPTAGPCRTPAPDATAEGAGDIRMCINCSGQLLVQLPISKQPNTLALTRADTRRLAEFLLGCEPLWSAR